MSTDTRLRQSIAKILVSQSPLHAQHALLHPAEGTDATDIGEIAHQLLLGGTSRFEVVDPSKYFLADGKTPGKDYKCKGAAAAWDAVRMSGKIPIDVKDFGPVSELVTKVSEFLAESALNLTGQSELEIEWTQDGVLCGGRLDHFIPERGLIIDFKFVEDARPSKLPGIIAGWGYDIQYAAYTAGVESLHPELRGRLDYLLVFCEKNAPFAITPARLAGSMKALGHSRWARAIEIWRACMADYGMDKPWPGYTDAFERVTAPAWALAAESEASEKFAEKLEEGIDA